MVEPLWTIMVYLSGDNNLSEEMILALKEMDRIPPNDYVRVVAQFDPSGLGVPTRRYDFSKPRALSGDGNLDHSAVDQRITLGDTNTGNPEALSDFIVWAHARYPATNNILVLSGHGSGAEEDFLLKDESAADSLTIPELQWALCKAKVPIRILGLDNCLMSTAEVIEAVSGHRPVDNGHAECADAAHVDYVIASEGFAPAQGWPYHRFLEMILANSAKYLQPGSTVNEVVKLVVDGYGRFYSDYDFAAGVSTDISAVDVKEIPALRGTIRTLAKELKDNVKTPEFRDQLLLAHWESQTYKFGQYVDLSDFCTRLNKRFDPKGPFSSVSSACKRTVDAVRQCVVRNCCTGPRVQHSYGLSIYFPWAVIHESYQQLSLPNETEWFDFLLEYIQSSRRGPRHEPARYMVAPQLAVPLEQQSNVEKVFQGRKRPDLCLSLGIGYLEGPKAPSSYAAERAGERRYGNSKYGNSKFQPGDSDLQPVTQWIQNPATRSGATCYARDEKDGKDFPLERA
jgi:hypothetical protein